MCWCHVQSGVRRLADLGCGTFGNVWLGHNSTFGKVAVKTVKVSFSHMRPLPVSQASGALSRSRKSTVKEVFQQASPHWK